MPPALHRIRHAAASLQGLSKGRALLPGEREFLAREFDQSLPLHALRICGGGHPIGRVAWQPLSTRIQLDDSCFEARDRARPVRVAAYPIFAHEALHVWQRVHRCCKVHVSVDGLWLGIFYGRAAYHYDRTLMDPQAVVRAFLAANIEQQGQMFEDYVRSCVEDATRRDPRFAAVAAYVRARRLG